MTTLSDASFPPGTVITGKWNRSRYTIRKLLGKGANGIVFLVQRGENGKHYALKMGFDPVDLQSEINVLKSFQLQRNHEALRQSGIPSYLKDVDDYAIRGRDIPFYVMRYVRGNLCTTSFGVRERIGHFWLDSDYCRSWLNCTMRDGCLAISNLRTYWYRIMGR